MYLAMMFITRDVENDSKATNLAAFLGVLLGGIVASWLSKKADAGPVQYAQYAVGLAAGLVAYGIVFALKKGPTLSR